MSVVTSNASGDSAARAGLVSARVRFRRSLTLMLMTLLMPGSAQLAAGNKRAGRIAVRLWLALLVVGLALVVIAFTQRSLMLTLVTDPGWLLFLRVLLIALALGWIVLFCDA